MGAGFFLRPRGGVPAVPRHPDFLGPHRHLFAFPYSGMAFAHVSAVPMRTWLDAAGLVPDRGGPKMAQMAGAVGKFLDRFDTNTEEKREKCLPSAGPIYFT